MTSLDLPLIGNLRLERVHESHDEVSIKSRSGVSPVAPKSGKLTPGIRLGGGRPRPCLTQISPDEILQFQRNGHWNRYIGGLGRAYTRQRRDAVVVEVGRGNPRWADPRR